jgi:hypothetical protein
VVAPDVAVLARQTAEDLGDEEGLGPFDALAEQVLTSLAGPVSEVQEQDCQSVNAPSRSWDRLAHRNWTIDPPAEGVLPSSAPMP